MADGLQENTADIATECEKFPGRLKDLCLGIGLDGRPNPTLKAHAAFREQRGLPPLPATVKRSLIVQPRELRPPQTPLTFLERAISAGKCAAGVAVNGFNPLSEEQIAARLAICETCDQFVNSKCKLCGCSCGAGQKLLNKLAHADQQCPYDPPKWGPVP